MDHVITSLTALFGRPELLLRNELHKIKQLEVITEANIHELIPMSIQIQQTICIFETLPNSNQHLNNPLLLEDILEKLPFNKQEQWINHSLNLGRPSTLKDFSDWLTQQSTILRMMPEQIIPRTSHKGASRKLVECHACKAEHTLTKCPSFKALTINERWNLVKRNNLCSSCFRPHHNAKDCKTKLPCGIDNCTKFHNRFLHNKLRPLIQGPQNVHCIQNNNKDLLLKIIPIKIYNGNISIETFAMIDEG